MDVCFRTTKIVVVCLFLSSEHFKATVFGPDAAIIGATYLASLTRDVLHNN
jgi:hypothetical protein